jgi:hypothetical protein
MIGVIADPSEHRVICEFFELFKTPWELYQSGRHYEVLLCSGDINYRDHTANLVLIYAGRKLPCDAEGEIRIASHRNDNRLLLYQGFRVPIYGDSITFRENGSDILLDQHSQEPAICLQQSKKRVLARVGYDLFREVRTLLTSGQPAGNAGIPALELHIAILRDLIMATGVRLVEIPPIPYGYRFIACLTHDVDHPSIRDHKFDHTMFGFLYRAVIGSLIAVFRGRASLSNLLTNWAAAMKLPFIFLGFAEDIWCGFDSYTTLERGLPSSFFVIPFKNRPGLRAQRPAPSRRASRYGAANIAVQIRKLMASGREIGLHGIDAWHDSTKGDTELQEIRRITGVQNIGVRMHWLYYDEQSPVVLEKVGVDYDSTVGYNETVGYRAGTSQAYQPLNATRLLELPLHIMDTALFFPGHLDLSPAEAKKLISSIIDNAVHFGGVVTVNWHDRSIAPERCWNDFYINVVDELRTKGAWFATAVEAVAWFRQRRATRLDSLNCESDFLHVNVTGGAVADLPPLHVEVHDTRSRVS